MSPKKLGSPAVGKKRQSWIETVKYATSPTLLKKNRRKSIGAILTPKTSAETYPTHWFSAPNSPELSYQERRHTMSGLNKADSAGAWSQTMPRKNKRFSLSNLLPWKSRSKLNDSLPDLCQPVESIVPVDRRKKCRSFTMLTSVENHKSPVTSPNTSRKKLKSPARSRKLSLSKKLRRRTIGSADVSGISAVKQTSPIAIQKFETRKRNISLSAELHRKSVSFDYIDKTPRGTNRYKNECSSMTSPPKKSSENVRSEQSGNMRRSCAICNESDESWDTSSKRDPLSLQQHLIKSKLRTGFSNKHYTVIITFQGSPGLGDIEIIPDDSTNLCRSLPTARKHGALQLNRASSEHSLSEIKHCDVCHQTEKCQSSFCNEYHNGLDHINICQEANLQIGKYPTRRVGVSSLINQSHPCMFCQSEANISPDQPHPCILCQGEPNMNDNQSAAAIGLPSHQPYSQTCSQPSNTTSYVQETPPPSYNKALLYDSHPSCPTGPSVNCPCSFPDQYISTAADDPSIEIPHANPPHTGLCNQDCSSLSNIPTSSSTSQLSTESCCSKLDGESSSTIPTNTSSHNYSCSLPTYLDPPALHIEIPDSPVPTTDADISLLDAKPPTGEAGSPSEVQTCSPGSDSYYSTTESLHPDVCPSPIQLDDRAGSCDSFDDLPFSFEDCFLDIPQQHTECMRKSEPSMSNKSPPKQLPPDLSSQLLASPLPWSSQAPLTPTLKQQEIPSQEFSDLDNNEMVIVQSPVLRPKWLFIPSKPVCSESHAHDATPPNTFSCSLKDEKSGPVVNSLSDTCGTCLDETPDSIGPEDNTPVDDKIPIVLKPPSYSELFKNRRIQHEGNQQSSCTTHANTSPYVSKHNNSHVSPGLDHHTLCPYNHHFIKHADTCLSRHSSDILIPVMSSTPRKEDKHCTKGIPCHPPISHDYTNPCASTCKRSPIAIAHGHTKDMSYCHLHSARNTPDLLYHSPCDLPGCSSNTDVEVNKPITVTSQEIQNTNEPINQVSSGCVEPSEPSELKDVSPAHDTHNHEHPQISIFNGTSLSPHSCSSPESFPGTPAIPASVCLAEHCTCPSQLHKQSNISQNHIPGHSHHPLHKDVSVIPCSGSKFHQKSRPVVAIIDIRKAFDDAHRSPSTGDMLVENHMHYHGKLNTVNKMESESDKKNGETMEISKDIEDSNEEHQSHLRLKPKPRRHHRRRSLRNIRSMSPCYNDDYLTEYDTESHHHEKMESGHDSNFTNRNDHRDYLNRNNIGQNEKNGHPVTNSEHCDVNENLPRLFCRTRENKFQDCAENGHVICKKCQTNLHSNENLDYQSVNKGDGDNDRILSTQIQTALESDDINTGVSSDLPKQTVCVTGEIYPHDKCVTREIHPMNFYHNGILSQNGDASNDLNDLSVPSQGQLVGGVESSLPQVEHSPTITNHIENVSDVELYDISLGYPLHKLETADYTVCIYSLQRNRQLMESVITPLTGLPQLGK